MNNVTKFFTKFTDSKKELKNYRQQILNLTKEKDTMLAELTELKTNKELSMTNTENVVSEVEKLKVDHATILSKLTSDFEAYKSESTKTMETINQTHSTELAKIKADYEKQIADLTAKTVVTENKVATKSAAIIQELGFNSEGIKDIVESTDKPVKSRFTFTVHKGQ